MHIPVTSFNISFIVEETIYMQLYRIPQKREAGNSFLLSIFFSVGVGTGRLWKECIDSRKTVKSAYMKNEQISVNTQ